MYKYNPTQRMIDLRAKAIIRRRDWNRYRLLDAMEQGQKALTDNPPPYSPKVIKSHIKRNG